ncbi:unnamed protein product, partial [Ectocarpus sp. 8 AP-2014]
RDEFKEYALAVRKRDRRGRVDEQPDPRERVGGRSHRGKDYSQDVRSSADDKPMSRYLPGDLPPSRQRSSLGHGSPESAARSPRGRGSSRDKYRGGDSPSGSSSRRGQREPSPRGAGDRGGGRGDRRGRDFSPPSRGSEGAAGWERGGRGKPQRGGSPRNKKVRYPGGEGGGGAEDYD